MARVVFLVVLLVATSAQWAAPGALRGQELLSNGGFEAGREGWREDGGSLEIVPAPVAEGDSAARLIVQGPASNMAARAVQQVSLQPGGVYRLSGQVRLSDPNVESVRIEIGWARPDGIADMRYAWYGRDTGGRYMELTAPDVQIPCGASQMTAAIVVRRLSPAVAAQAYFDALRLETAGPAAACPTPSSPPPPPPAPRPTEGVIPTPGDRPEDAPPATVALPMSGLLANGGFEVAEAGRPAGWRNQGGALGQVRSPVHGGRFAGAFASASTSTKWVYQTVPVTPLGWYLMDGYVELDGPLVRGALLRVSWYASSDGGGGALASVDSTQEMTSPGGGYRYLTTGPVQAPPGARSAKARILLRPRSAMGGAIFIDDVSFGPTGPGRVPGETADAGRDGSAGGRARGSDGGVSAARGGPGGVFDDRPTPVVRRREKLDVAPDVPAAGGSLWWPWALGGLLVAGAAGWAGYRGRTRLLRSRGGFAKLTSETENIENPRR